MTLRFHQRALPAGLTTSLRFSRLRTAGPLDHSLGGIAHTREPEEADGGGEHESAVREVLEEQGPARLLLAVAEEVGRRGRRPAEAPSSLQCPAIRAED